MLAPLSHWSCSTRLYRAVWRWAHECRVSSAPPPLPPIPAKHILKGASGFIPANSLTGVMGGSGECACALRGRGTQHSTAQRAAGWLRLAWVSVCAWADAGRPALLLSFSTRHSAQLLTSSSLHSRRATMSVMPVTVPCLGAGLLGLRRIRPKTGSANRRMPRLLPLSSCTLPASQRPAERDIAHHDHDDDDDVSASPLSLTVAAGQLFRRDERRRGATSWLSG